MSAAGAGRLAAAEVSVSLGRRRVLGRISADFERGRVTGVLGPNGAGKSTLLRALCGILELDTGEVRLGGAAGRPDPRRVAYVPQAAECQWPMPCRRIVELGRIPHGGEGDARSAKGRAAVEAAMEAMGVSGLAGRAANAISGGELRRVLIARALATEPEFLLLDEPTAGLDPYHQLHLMQVLRGLAAKGAGVVVTLHDLPLAASHCDALLLLKEGEVAAHGVPGDVLKPEQLMRCYGVNCEVDWTASPPAVRMRL